MGSGYSSPEIYNINSVPAVSSDVSYVDAISSIAYKTNISKAYAGQSINIKVKFEAKQADNVTWSSIDSYQLYGIAA